MAIVSGYLALIVIGITLGLFGGGGAILTVPVMVYLFGQTPVEATGYSLAVVGATSLAGGLQYRKSGQVDMPVAVWFALPAFVGTLLARRWLTPSLPAELGQFGSFTLTKGHLVMLVFAVVMIAASVAMIRPADRVKASSDTGPHLPGLILPGFLVGTLAGFVGAGGGFLIIPALVSFAALPIHTAIGTSLLIIGANSLVGVAGDLAAGVVFDWVFLLVALFLGYVGMRFGAKISSRITPARLKPAFGWFVLVMGIVILVSQFLRQ